jgi:hypothetical protein
VAEGINGDVSAGYEVGLIESCFSRLTIIKQSVFHRIGSIDFAASSYTPDLMHILFENIMKHLLATWDGSPKARQARQHQDPFVIDAGKWLAMADDIQRSNATTPAQVVRAFDSPLDTRSKWTAETYCHFLLFLGPIILQDRLPQPYYEHFLKLSAAARTLTAVRIKRADVNALSRTLGD